MASFAADLVAFVARLRSHTRQLSDRIIDAGSALPVELVETRITIHKLLKRVCDEADATEILAKAGELENVERQHHLEQLYAVVQMMQSIEAALVEARAQRPVPALDLSHFQSLNMVSSEFVPTGSGAVDSTP
jgi:hypothetical protein